MPKFNAVDNEIYVKHDDGNREKTLLVVGGSLFKASLASEIAEVLNRHYNQSN